jgi:hypothetical protein
VEEIVSWEGEFYDVLQVSYLRSEGSSLTRREVARARKKDKYELSSRRRRKGRRSIGERSLKRKRTRRVMVFALYARGTLRGDDLVEDGDV